MRTLFLRLSLALMGVAAACTAEHQGAASGDAARTAGHPATNQPRTRIAQSAKQRLAALDSSVTWELQSVLVADVDCDGKPDSVVVGRSPVRVAVGVIRTNGLAPDVISFGTHGATVEDEVGSSDAQLALESLDYNPRDMIGEIDGFQRSTVCKGLNLGDGESDSMHLFWNHKSHQLDWWRL